MCRKPCCQFSGTLLKGGRGRPFLNFERGGKEKICHRGNEDQSDSCPRKALPYSPKQEKYQQQRGEHHKGQPGADSGKIAEAVVPCIEHEQVHRM